MNSYLRNCVRKWVLFVALATVITGLPGCGEKDKTETLNLKGRIEKVKPSTDTTGEITVRFFHEKQNAEMVGTALVTAETKIEKGGVPGSFKDLQEGAAVKGQVRVEKISGQKKFTAVLIQIDDKSAPASGPNSPPPASAPSGG